MKQLLSKFSLFLIMPLMIVVGLIFAIAHFSAQAEQSQPNLWSALGSDKTQVSPGEVFQYTIQIQNKDVRNFTNVLARPYLSTNVDYVSGSGAAEKNGQTISVIDQWVTTSTNVGTLIPTQIAYVRFSVKVKSDVAVGTQITTGAEVMADGVNWSAVQESVSVVSANDRAHFVGGDFLKVANVTVGNDGWHNQSVNADYGNVIEYQISITNDSQFDARNVSFQAFLPGPDKMGLVLHPYVTVSSDNADAITDNVDVNLANPSYLLSYPDHGRKFGTTGLYDCAAPDAQGGCPIPNQYYSSPMNIGTVSPGVTKMIQVIFKSAVVNYSTPTPSPTPTPTPTPMPTCNQTCTTANDACQNGTVCTQVGDVYACRLPSNPSSNTCSPVVTPTPTPTATCNRTCNQDSDCGDSNLGCFSQGNNNSVCRLKKNQWSSSCVSEGGFFVRKFYDHNGNGHQDAGDEGLDWHFQFDENGDNNWRDYQTFAASNGEGGVVTLPEGMIVRIREVGQNGWSVTTPSEDTITIVNAENQAIVFGNWHGKPTMTTPGPITSLPKSGANLTLGFVSAAILGGVGVIASLLAL